MRVHRQLGDLGRVLARRAVAPLGDKTGAAPPLQIAQRRQPVVGLHHGGRADLQLARQLADGRRACAGAHWRCSMRSRSCSMICGASGCWRCKAANGTVMLKSPIQYRCNSGQLYCQLYGFVAMMCAELAQSDFYPPADLETLP